MVIRVKKKKDYMFCYQKSFANPTLPVDEAQFYALVRAEQWNENIDKYRETHDAALKRKLPAFIFQATFDETTSKAGKVGRWRKQSATRLTGLVVMDVDHIDDPIGLVNEKLGRVMRNGLRWVCCWSTLPRQAKVSKSCSKHVMIGAT